MPNQTTVTLTDGYRAEVQSRHHSYAIDEPISSGGTDTAPTPTETLMGALGACIAITVKMYAERKGWKLDKIEVKLDFERFAGKDYAEYDGEAQFVHEIREVFSFEGDLTEEQREKLLEIASKCPVSRVIELPAFFKRTMAELEV
jgi:putative redox protein